MTEAVHTWDDGEERVTLNDPNAPHLTIDAVMYRTVTIGRWWRLTERGARRMVWGEFGWTRRQPIREIVEDARYEKAKIGYWVVLEQRWYKTAEGRWWSDTDAH